MSDEKDVFLVTKELGLRLRSLRERAGLTQGEPALDGLDRQLRRKWQSQMAWSSGLGSFGLQSSSGIRTWGLPARRAPIYNLEYESCHPLAASLDCKL